LEEEVYFINCLIRDSCAISQCHVAGYRNATGLPYSYFFLTLVFEVVITNRVLIFLNSKKGQELVYAQQNTLRYSEGEVGPNDIQNNWLIR
jgi:hypothetical protein